MPRRPAPVLNVVTHNVGGFTSLHQVIALLRCWDWQKAHVVCVQETWVGRREGQSEQRVRMWLQQAALELAIPEPQAWFGSNTLADGHRAGVAVLLMRKPSADRSLDVRLQSVSLCGRCMLMSVKWAGHNISLVNTYWPNDRTLQRRFLGHVLSPVLARVRPGSLMLAGDFNFVPDVPRDRSRLPDGTTWNADRRAEQLFAADAHAHLCRLHHGLDDVYRVKHPTSAGFTRVTAGSASRLDRIHTASSLLPFVRTCRVAGSPVSDHSPLVVSVLPAVGTAPAAGGVGRWRANTAFMQDPELCRRLHQWVETAVALGLAMPEPDLLLWWPRLKGYYRRRLQDLHRQHQANRAGVPDIATAQRVYGAALQHLYTATPDAQRDALAAAVAAQTALRVVVQPHALAAQQRQHAKWLHARESPGPTFTRLLKPAVKSSGPPVLAASSGELVTDPARMANMLVQHFSQVSAPRQVSLQAQHQVLAAMEAQQREGTARTIPAAAADLAGLLDVSVAEVNAALTALPCGKAPGPDGITAECWKKAAGGWAPLLARLFSIIGRGDAMPQGFTRGVVASLHKGGEVSQTSNYRPITLLNADYKVLARVLATRFSAAMGDSIGLEQTAFLPRRHIGDGIAVAQLLPAALSTQGMTGGVVLLDIAKAYDTVDRDFLLRAMATHGASPGMQRWVSLLLRDTCATAHVQGQASAEHVWHAGVRQGCPLSPVLYLYVAEALACWLRASPELGVVVDGKRYVSTHFADDTKVFLSSLEAPRVDALLAHVQVFTDASGQAVHAGKSSGVPLGTSTARDPGITAAIPVRDSDTSLGVVVKAITSQPLQMLRDGLRGVVRDPAPQPQRMPPEWQQRIQSVRTMCNMLAGQPLSAMGRGLAASGYALNGVLFHAEYEGLPPQAEAQLQSLTCRIVDRAAGMRGLHDAQLYGSPQLGGFGLLPLGQHVAARHAKQATVLLSALCAPEAPGQPMWIGLARLVLTAVCPTLHPAQTLLLAVFASEDHAAQGRLSNVNAQRCLIPDGPLRHMAVALRRLGPLHLRVPQGVEAGPAQSVWDLLATAVPDAPQPLFASLRRLAWTGQGDALRPLSACTVRQLTALQVAPSQLQRIVAHRAYAAQALSHSAVFSPAVQEQRTQSFLQVFRTVWKVPWDNKYKEVLFRLALNGIAGCGGLGIPLAGECSCGHHLTDAQIRARDTDALRQHGFWSCTVAVAVRQCLQRCLPPNTVLQQWHVWLLQPPQRSGIRPVVWRVVALAALYAMNCGRRYLWYLQTDQADMEAAQRLRLAGAKAVADFWLALHDFASAAAPDARRGWGSVGGAHPFLCVRPAQPGAEVFSFISVNVPVV